MPVSPARQAAYRILRRLESGSSYAVDLLQHPQIYEMKEVDRRLTTELVMGVLRWRGELDYWIEHLSGKPLRYFDPEIATILRMGIYQLGFLEKIPKSAVVNESVELAKAARKRSAAGLVNAVLRKHEMPEQHARGRPASVPEDARVDAALRSLPNWLGERWEKNFGAEAAKALACASAAVPPTTLRVALPGKSREEIQRELAAEGVKTRAGLFSPAALLVESGNLQSSRCLAEGRVVIQDEASQLVAQLVAPQPGQRVLDLCAAPGMKTSQLSAVLGKGLLVACELSATRLRTLAKLLRGRIPAEVRFQVVRLDARIELPFALTFERILLDVPCSGTGTLARNPEIKGRLQPGDLPRLAAAQEKMLRNALGVLAPGGRLVYATCSLEPEENEQVVERALQAARGCRLLTADELAAESPALAPLFDSRGYFRTRPDLHSMDGFVAATILRTP